MDVYGTANTMDIYCSLTIMQNDLRPERRTLAFEYSTGVFCLAMSDAIASSE
jgi:hypothetical protein